MTNLVLATLAAIESEVSDLDASLSCKQVVSDEILRITGRSRRATVAVYTTKQMVRVIIYGRNATHSSNAWFELADPQCIENAAQHVVNMIGSASNVRMK